MLKDDEIIIPRGVYNELLVKDSSEKDLLQTFLETGNVTVVEATKNRITSKSLGVGEMAAINVAKEKSIDDIIIDDKRARSLARSVGLTTYGTLWILLRAVKNKKITKDKAYNIICELPRHGFRIDSEFLLQVVKKLH